MKPTPVFQPLPGDAKTVKPAVRPQGGRSFGNHVPAQDTNHSGSGAAVVSDARATTRTPRQAWMAAPEQLSAAAAGASYGVGARIYPQSLAVVGYLSMAIGRGEAPASACAPLGADAFTTRPEGGEAASAARVVPATGQVPGDEQADVSRCIAGATSAFVADAEAPADGIDALRAALSAGVSPRWLARRLSIINGPRGQAIYLRDYGLADNERDAAVQALHAHAARAGQTVARIFVNGRECWRAEGMPVSDTRGDQEHVG